MSRHKNKVKVEVLFDKEKDAEIIEYMERNVTTKAGFIRQIVKEYVHNHTINKERSFSEQKKEAGPEPEIEIKQETASQQKEKAKPKKKMPSFGQSFSATNLLDQENK
ncbi:hypothetical protein [Alkalihalobacterium sp. APHAB7]|uniref:hypothetical protein n=1 Tax=Alkalihalobacterium sp. APHAB7 TaxID=3402081 RepID=UPI003AAC740D